MGGACVSPERPFVVEWPLWGCSPVECRPPIQAFYVVNADEAHYEKPADDEAAAGDDELISEVAEGAQFYISPAKAREFCLAIGKDTKDPRKVKLARITGDNKQKWTLVGGTGFKNVHNGECLDSDLSYVFVSHLDHIWNDNHSDLCTAPRHQGPSQKWAFGPETFHGGKVLRHFMDGRGVDIHGWEFTDGGNVGVENSVHSTCDGVSYVLQMCDSYESNHNRTQAEEGEL